MRGRRIFREGVAGVEFEVPGVGLELGIVDREDTEVEEGTDLAARALNCRCSFALLFRSERSIYGASSSLSLRFLPLFGAGASGSFSCFTSAPPAPGSAATRIFFLPRFLRGSFAVAETDTGTSGSRVAGPLLNSREL